MTEAGAPYRAIVADDQRHVLEALRLLLRPEGWVVETASGPDALLEAAAAREFDVALVDLNYTRDTTSGREGLDLLARLPAVDPHLPVVVMTAWGSIELAVEAMRRGARDFVQKPWDNARLLATLRTQADLARALRRAARLEAENRLLRDDAALACGADGAADGGATDGGATGGGTGRGGAALVGESAGMRAALDLVARVAPSDANVLLTGENGTGKGLLARRLHRLSPRADRPLVTVDVGALPEGLFESELFGHVRGAFTDARADRLGRFEIADGGTLFLDEIGNLGPAQQAKLLRVLESGEFERVGSSRVRRVDVRVISATHVDLRAAVAEGRFRQDLLFRLDTVEIRIPPLRERRDDIVPLAQRFLARAAARFGRPVAGLGSDALEALLRHPWPGNVRELEHAVERAVLLASDDRIGAADLGLPPALAPAAAAARGAPAPTLEDLSLEDVERMLIRKALDRYAGNVTQAAQALGLSRSALYRRFRRHGL